MRRAWGLFLGLALLPAPLAAQGSGPASLCWRAGSIERCRAIVLTNFGSYVESGTPGGGGLNIRAMADYGILVNVGERSAVGGTLFASLGRNSEFVLGPAVRYRRWLGSRQSIDLGLGTPIIGSGPAPHGLIKYNITNWVGVALRPEYRRDIVVNVCDGGGCTDARRSRFVVAGGVELGWIPGFTATVVSGAVGLLVVAAALAGGN